MIHSVDYTYVDNLFFFSSRRRHTRSKRDWSSDVCSSDLRLVRGRAGLSCAAADEAVRRRATATIVARTVTHGPARTSGGPPPRFPPPSRPGGDRKSVV